MWKSPYLHRLNQKEQKKLTLLATQQQLQEQSIMAEFIPKK